MRAGRRPRSGASSSASTVFGRWYFLWQAHGAAFFLLAGLVALVLAMSAQFSRRDPAAAWLCVPYLLWLLFAAYLNLGVWLLNR